MWTAPKATPANKKSKTAAAVTPAPSAQAAQQGSKRQSDASPAAEPSPETAPIGSHSLPLMSDEELDLALRSMSEVRGTRKMLEEHGCADKGAKGSREDRSISIVLVRIH